MKKRSVVSAMMTLALCGCFAAGIPAAAAEEQVVIDNFNLQTTYDSVPERVVSLSYSETEILLALGLGDKIVGIAEADNTVEAVSEEYREEAAGLNIIAACEDGGVPTLEVVLAQSPDFVYGTSYSYNANYGVGDVSDFQNSGINVYATTSTYKENPTIEDTYEDILNLGKIFRVEDRANEVVEEMKTEIAAITEKIKDAEPVTVLCYDSGEESPVVYFSSSYEGSLVALAGGKNVFEQEGNAALLSWEAIVEANPDYILINDWAGGAGAMTLEEKINYMKSRPELQTITAIQEENFIAVPLNQVSFGGISNVDAVETIARGLYPDCF